MATRGAIAWGQHIGKARLVGRSGSRLALALLWGARHAPLVGAASLCSALRWRTQWDAVHARANHASTQSFESCFKKF